MAKTDTFNQKEIAAAINNAVVFAKAPNKLGEISPKRLAELHEYAVALIQPLREELEIAAEIPQKYGAEFLPMDKYLKPEEAVLILLAGALVFQAHHVMGTNKLPALETTSALLEKK